MRTKPTAESVRAATAGYMRRSITCTHERLQVQRPLTDAVPRSLVICLPSRSALDRSLCQTICYHMHDAVVKLERPYNSPI